MGHRRAPAKEAVAFAHYQRRAPLILTQCREPLSGERRTTRRGSRSIEPCFVTHMIQLTLASVILL